MDNHYSIRVIPHVNQIDILFNQPQDNSFVCIRYDTWRCRFYLMAWDRDNNLSGFNLLSLRVHNVVFSNIFIVKCVQFVLQVSGSYKCALCDWVMPYSWYVWLIDWFVLFIATLNNISAISWPATSISSSLLLIRDARQEKGPGGSMS
jgi:hypothetical protein